MNRPDDASSFIVNPRVLQRLRCELEDDEGWLVFVRQVISNLPHRIEKLCSALIAADRELAIDAVLSLKTSSYMVGAERLADLALQLEQSLANSAAPVRGTMQRPHQADLLAGIKACAAATGTTLAITVPAHLSRPPRPD